MSDLGRQFDPHRNYPVVRSANDGQVNFTAVDPEGNRSYHDWLDQYHEVTSDVDEAEARYDDAQRRYNSTGDELNDATDGDDNELWEQAEADHEDASAEWQWAQDAMDAANDRRYEHDEAMPAEHAIGTIQYRQQKFGPTDYWEHKRQDRDGKPRTLFTESQSPYIDMWGADPSYAGEGVGKELLNHAVEEHWTHFPKERGTLPPISARLSADSLDVLERHGGEGATADIEGVWTDSRDRMDRFARQEIRTNGADPARLYMDHVHNGLLPEEGLDVSDPPTSWGGYTQTTVPRWPSTSFSDKVGELEARTASEEAAAEERKGRWTGPLSKAARNPGSAAHLAAQFDSPTGQLPLFVTGKELRGAATPHPGDRLNETDGLDRTESTQELWARKKSEADASGMTESIAKRGIVRPVRITGGGIIKNGNHRVAGLGDDQWTSPDYDDNEGSMPGPMGDAPARFRPELVGLPKFNAR